MDQQAETTVEGILHSVAENLRQNPADLNTYRQALKQKNDALDNLFRKNTPIEKLVCGRSNIMDKLLESAWHNHMGAAADKATLIAVGGYGRGELHPSSDIDLMILVEDQAEAHGESISQLLTFFWDIGLEVGHSVRNVNECVKEAENDITVATTIMESRYLAGNPVLFDAMRDATAAENIWPSNAFFTAKLEEQQARHLKFGETAYNLEPNIKEGPGGLRDIQVIGWVAKRHYDVETMHGLVEHGFLSEDEYHTLMDGQQLLWRIRYALHLTAKRREDRLLFDHQRTLAELFGYQSEEHNLAVEQFMQKYYRTIMELSRLNEILLQHFQEAIVHKGVACTPKNINRRFQSCNGYLEAVDDDIFVREPYALLELFLLLAQQPELKGVRASTIRLIRQNRHLIDENFRQDLRNRALFMEFMRQPRGITHELRRMNLYGVLARYIPSFAGIVGRMQYDLFHIFTVDEHTLYVVRNLRRFMLPVDYQEYPLCTDIIRKIPKPELLYLAGLFHDIAKGRGGDHSELGTQDAIDFCRLHQLSSYDTNLVAWLVRNHLMMSMTIQRKDINDPEVIQEFAALVSDQNRLDHIYLLTTADSNATNPKRWSSWKYSLLNELYHNTRRALLRGLDNPRAQDEEISARRKQAEEELEKVWKKSKEDAEKFWSIIGDDYFLHNLPDQIARRTAALLNSDPEKLPLVKVLDANERGGSEILVYAKQRIGVFATTTSMLDQLGLNIVDARLQITTDGSALYSYMVLEDDEQAISDLRRKEEVIETLRYGIQHPDEINPHVSRRVARRLKHFETTTQIEFNRDINHDRTILRIQTGDRPGLLARISTALNDCDIRLMNAKIGTVGEVAEDIFFIIGRESESALTEEQQKCLKSALNKRLEE